MSCLNKSFPVNKVEDLSNIKGPESPLVVETVSLSCGRCAMLYAEYKQLLAHLFWRHGTESSWCKTCGLKRWLYAPHVCHVLPINDGDIEDSTNSRFHDERESDYCFCGKYVEESPMIGCDGARCSLQWYHFKCVGIVSPPDGDWFCPECIKSKGNTVAKKQVIGVNT